MKVVILLDYSFPSSNASANRYLSIAKAVKHLGHKVEIISIQATQGSEKNNNYSFKGVYEGIEYHNSSGIFYRHNNFFVRSFFRIYGKLNSFVLIYKGNKKEKIDYIFVPTSTPLLDSLFFFYFKLLKIKSLMEMNEFPEIFQRGNQGKFLYFCHQNILIKCRLLDGMVLMTYVLQKYYIKNTCGKLPTFVMPMSVDIQRFELSCTVDKNHNKYIAYCGGLSNEKDGIDILIKAFGVITKKHQNIKLYIISSNSSKITIDYLKHLCDEFNISDKVIFTGHVDRNDIPLLLKNASILALARPTSYQAEGGFPTKLGEYLATKNPIIVTDVGEITQYLKDGDSAYISKPDDIEAFAQKLDECLSDPDKAKLIGEKGYQIAEKYFDYKSQSELLNEFLIKLK